MDLFSVNLYDRHDVNLYDVTINCQELTKLVDLIQRSKLRLTGRQCDHKLSTGDQIFRTGRQVATCVLSNN